ncbi:MAG: SWIM zinc finger family protein [Oscillospiraceae bacterium]|nr:SWIM zinc finger family protein [Oscillospiraceae bacterium]
MATADIITDELIRTLAPNAAAVANGKKISSSGDFISLSKTEDDTLIFGECMGSGKNPYHTSADFSGDAPVFRCSCPSRQFPCKHSLALMYEWLAKKSFSVSEIPDDLAQKREKATKRAEKAAMPSEKKKAPKQNKSAAEKKLKKQAEGLELAEKFVTDMFTRGISSVSRVSAEQYKSLAKQLGDYYLPEPQAIMNEIVSAAERLSAAPDDSETDRLTALCVKLSSTIKKSRAYIASKLESGDVLPEDSILYEAMGNVWKLSQLKEIGLYKENAAIIQLSFTVLHDDMHKADIDTAYWADIETGEISKTENIRPLKAQKYIKAQDSVFGIHFIKELYRYPGGMNRRIRWEAAEITDAAPETYPLIISKAEGSISEAVKNAKNELKNTLSDSFAAMLIRFDSIEFAKSDGHPVMKLGGESIALKANENYPEAVDVLKVTSRKFLENGALLGELFYIPEEKRIFMCPISIVNEKGIMRLC